METATRNIAPSRVARTMAAAQWPDVQDQRKCTRGVFGFTCSGHGGLIAVIGEADLPDAAITAARETGRTGLVVFSPGRTFTTEKWTPDSLTAWAESRGYPIFEVWIGEEDCDFATLCYANDEIRTGGIRSGYFSESCTAEYCRENIDRWNEEWLAIFERES